MLAFSLVTVWELVVENFFSTGYVLSESPTACGKLFFHRFCANYETVHYPLTYLDLMPYVEVVVERPLHRLLFWPWASTLRTVTPIGRSTWTNFVMSTVLIWSTPWSRFFLRQRTSTVLWLHWKTRWTISKLSTGHSGISKGALQFICSPHTPQHHGNSLTHRNRNAQPHCG